eukprot:TRINITY_DN21837_c0_g1_i1.p1 TRINITY_DN21837_c0_g1~~TRINITY_DN21837_c0_g1_i1.p1  ORF type:complete len:401 (-),score=45.52 TRINITY_DN21837_c0_g1_i1:638-1768(-)
MFYLVLVFSVLCTIRIVAADVGASDSNYRNPVRPPNHPDPGVFWHAAEKMYYAVTTSGNAGDVFPIMTSADLVTWHINGSVFPNGSGRRPVWAKSDFWAPEIHELPAGPKDRFIVYFSARHNDGTLSVGAAKADHPKGPYTAVAHPLVHTPGMGNIDASFATLPAADSTSHSTYLIWKKDGNGARPPVPTPIYARPVDPANGAVFVGPAVELISNTLRWEGVLVEGPWLVWHAPSRWWFLFYSANGYASASYGVGVARSRALTGPYEKRATPILHTRGFGRDVSSAVNATAARSASSKYQDLTSSSALFSGPGHCSVVKDPSGTHLWMVYHAWPETPGHGGRAMLLDDVVIGEDGWPSVNRGLGYPSSDPRPAPRV